MTENLMNLNGKEIAQLLKLSEQYIVLNKVIYGPNYPDDHRVFKLLAQDDIDFESHIPDYFVYPDYAIGKILNQGIRLTSRVSSLSSTE
jgi:hypothetical protein